MQDLIDIIERGFEQSGRMEHADEREQLTAAVEQAIAALDKGEARVAEQVDGQWQVNQWLKKAVLLSFRLADNQVIPGGHSKFYDKVPMKYADYSEQDFRNDGVRVVPDAIVRRGMFLKEFAQRLGFDSTYWNPTERNRW